MDHFECDYSAPLLRLLPARQSQAEGVLVLRVIQRGGDGQGHRQGRERPALQLTGNNGAPSGWDRGGGTI